LKDFLKDLGEYGGYAGLSADCNLYDAQLDSTCSLRFQTTFLPASSETSLASKMMTSLPAFLGGRPPAKLEFCTEAYNYNTMSDEDPRNLVLLCTTQGVAVQQDGEGSKKLLHHAVDDGKTIHRYWLEAEETRHQVGGQQKETAEERQDALARGKAMSSVIGTRAMGQRFNVLMTIQVPLKQKPQAKPRGLLMGTGAFTYGFDCCDSLGSMDSVPMACAASLSAGPFRMKSRARGSAMPTGRSSAARVSKGSEYDTWNGLSVTSPARQTAEHVTITVVIYNIVTDGVPSEEDVVRAIDDMECLYASSMSSGRLADSAFDFMKKPLQAQEVQDIATKLTFQPPSQPVQNFAVFP